MDRKREHRIGMAIAAFSLVVACQELRAQGTTSTATTSSLAGAGTTAGNMELMGMMSAMNPTASLSPTDAAALGMQRPSNGAMGMNAVNGVFMNPMAAPYLLGMPMSNTDIGALMLSNRMGMSGLGSGQLSGVRPGVGQSKGRSKPVTDKPRGTASTPAGLAARYFNRTASVNRPVNVSRIPQNYYVRPNRYYPQVAR